MNLIRKPAVLIPLIYLTVSWLAAQCIALIGGCDAGWNSLCWAKWDSSLYLDIVAQGHTLFNCPEDATKWCGNAGWAPLYPLLMWLLHQVGIAPTLGGLIISQCFFLGLLLVTAKLWDIKDFSLRSWLGIGITAFTPGAIYFQTLFPISMVVFFMGLVHLFIIREKWFYAGIASFLAVLSYSSGQLLLGSFAFYGIYLIIRQKKLPLKPLFYTLLPAIIGLFIWFVYDFVLTGKWDAMFLIQQKYGHGLQSPLRHFGNHLKRLYGNPWSLISWVEIQNLFLMIYVIFSAFVAFGKKQLDSDRFQGFYLLVFWFLPYSISMDVSLYRGCTLLAPASRLHKNSSLKLLTILFISSLLLYVPIGILFIKGLII